MKILLTLCSLLTGLTACGAVDNAPCYVDGIECNSQGEPGETAATGPQGQPGIDGAIGPRGATGNTGVGGERGPAGESGAKGDRGLPGLDGQDGETGPQGPQGDPGVTIYDPCGDLSGWDDQVVFILPSGEWVMDGYILEPGESYKTKDKQKCVFTVPN